ncbi:hypothetical protein Tco_1304741, partial [Tanacetum coccineum]
MKFKIRAQQPDPIAPIPTIADIEKDHLTEAQVILALAESAKEAEARENVKLVKEVVLNEEVDKLVEGDEEVDKLIEGDERFEDSLILSQEDSSIRLEPGSHKESPKEEKEDDDCDYVDIALIRKRQTCSLEIREEKKQTPLVTTPRSPRIDLSSDKAPAIELTETNISMFDVPSYSTSHCVKHLRGVVARVTKRKNKKIKTMKKNFVHRSEVQNLCTKIEDTFDNEVFPLVEDTTGSIVKANLRRIIKEEMHKETSVKDEFRSMVTTKLLATAPRQIEEFLQRYMQIHAIAFQSCASTLIPALQEKLYKAMKDSLDAQAAELLRTSIQLYEESNCLGKRKEELIPQIPEKEAPIFFDHQRDQNEPPRFFMEQGFVFLKNGNTKAKKYDLSLHKIHATPFPEDDLEELLTRWV